MAVSSSSSLLPRCLLAAALALCAAATMGAAQAITRKYHFDVGMTSVTRLCGTKSMATVNGQFPGPTLFAREGDHVEVDVVNNSPTTQASTGTACGSCSAGGTTVHPT
ncbi:hypothetical protein ZWY2020_007853 [Hordeum vulgare]|nr:hypothetical protein ZWY2020_007853 [Hordeum vulgare]